MPVLKIGLAKRIDYYKQQHLNILNSDLHKAGDVCMTGGIMHPPSHTNVYKFYDFQHIFSQLIFHLKC